MRLPAFAAHGTFLLVAATTSAPLLAAPAAVAVPGISQTAQRSPVGAAPPAVMRVPSTETPTAPPPPPAPPASGSQQQQRATYTVLAFTVWTGGDDLRSNSSVAVDVHLPDGTTTHCDLRPGNDTWDNNTAHAAPPCALPAALRLGQLKKAQIDLLYNGNYMTHEGDQYQLWRDWDNWDVNQVRVIAENPAQHQQICLLDVKGEPLVRMKKTNASFRVTDVMSSC